MEALCAEAEALASAYEGELRAAAAPPTLDPGARLFIKSRCGFSSAVLLAMDNLHLGERLAVVNVSDQAGAIDELRGLTGKEQAPCLVADGEALLESKEIIRHLVDRIAPV
jgi:glutathione S-transferase